MFSRSVMVLNENLMDKFKPLVTESVIFEKGEEPNLLQQILQMSDNHVLAASITKSALLTDSSSPCVSLAIEEEVNKNSFK